MSDTHSSNRFVAVILTLSVLLLCLAILPISVGATANPSSAQKDGGTGASLSLIVNDIFDFREGENTSLRFGFLKSVQTKWLNGSDGFFTVSAPISSAPSIPRNSHLIEIGLQAGSVKIANHLHAKDGMV